MQVVPEGSLQVITILTILRILGSFRVLLAQFNSRGGVFMICDPADPHRCQAVNSRGQCEHLALEGLQLCETHHKHPNNIRKKHLQHYLLSNPDLQKRLNRQAAVEEVRSLREEIHLARVMVEARLDLIEENDRGDMLAAFSNVNTYLATIEKLVSSCHRMEVSLGNLLSKASVFTLGQEIVNILVDELQHLNGYEKIIDKISERIVVIIAKQQNKEKRV